MPRRPRRIGGCQDVEAILSLSRGEQHFSGIRRRMAEMILLFEPIR
jgi:hypothetical protein